MKTTKITPIEQNADFAAAARKLAELQGMRHQTETRITAIHKALATPDGEQSPTERAAQALLDDDVAGELIQPESLRKELSSLKAKLPPIDLAIQLQENRVAKIKSDLSAALCGRHHRDYAAIVKKQVDAHAAYVEAIRETTMFRDAIEDAGYSVAHLPQVGKRFSPSLVEKHFLLVDECVGEGLHKAGDLGTRPAEPAQMHPGAHQLAAGPDGLRTVQVGADGHTIKTVNWISKSTEQKTGWLQ